MLEDKLKRDERIRLEALNQSNTSLLHQGAPVAEVMRRAKVFENYIKTGAADKDSN